MMTIYARLVAAALILLALAGAGWKAFHDIDAGGYRRAQGEYQTQALEAERQARAAEQAKVVAVNKVEIKHEETKRIAAADHAAAQSELERLRDTIASRGPTPVDPAAAIRSDDASRERYVLGQCAVALTKLAETADSIEARMSGLQDYVKTVCK